MRRGDAPTANRAAGATPAPAGAAGASREAIGQSRCGSRQHGGK